MTLLACRGKDARDEARERQRCAIQEANIGRTSVELHVPKDITATLPGGALVQVFFNQCFSSSDAWTFSAGFHV